MIPKTLHNIWIGDEAERPENCIRIWIDGNPGRALKLCGNAVLDAHGRCTATHLR